MMASPMRLTRRNTLLGLTAAVTLGRASLALAEAPTDRRFIVVILRGALDGLPDAEVDRLKPENGADTLYTRLRGGRDAKISKQAVIARSPAKASSAPNSSSLS